MAVKKKQKSVGAPAGIPSRPNFSRVSTAGTEISSGFIGILEENLVELQNSFDRAKAMDRMRRSNPTVEALLSSIELPIRRATFDVEPASDDPDDVERAELIRWGVLESMNWAHFLENSLTFKQFGNAVFEAVFEVKDWERSITNEDGSQQTVVIPDRVVPSGIDYMAAKTIYRYRWDKDTNQLSGIDQMGWWIIDGKEVYKEVFIPSDFLIFIVNQQRGRNYDGISLLRCCYGDHVALQELYKMEMIALAKNAGGVVIITEPENGATDEDRAAALNLAQTIRMGEYSGATMPHGWKIEILDGKVDTSGLQNAQQHHKGQILLAGLAQFLQQGADHQSGNRALATTFVDFFKLGLWATAEQICSVLNHTLIPMIIGWNYTGVTKMPKIRMAKLAGDDITAWVNNLNNLVTNQVIAPYPELTDAVIAAMDLPPRSQEVGDQDQLDQTGAAVQEDVSEGQSASSGGAGGGGQMHHDPARRHGLITLAESHSGFMVCLSMPESIAERLAIPGGEPAKKLHVTLGYIPNAASLGVSGLSAAEQVVKQIAASTAPLEGFIGGWGVFSASAGSDGKAVLYASVDLPGLPRFRQELVNALDAAGLPVSKMHGYSPHITLAYLDGGSKAAQMQKAAQTALKSSIAVTFGECAVAAGSLWYRYPLTGAEVKLSDGTIELEDPHWVTMEGAHVFIGKDGTIEKGPAKMVGKTPGQASGKSKAANPADRWEKVHYDKEAKTWRDEKGNISERANAVKPPPANTNVEVNHNENGKYAHQSIDKNGKQQKSYTEAGRKASLDEKFSRQAPLESNRSKLMDKAHVDMKEGAKNRDTAAAVAFMAHTGARNGSEEATLGGKKGKEGEEHFGTSSLLGRHVTVDGDTVRAEFMGKSGQVNVYTAKDPQLAAVVKSNIAERGQDGRVFATTPGKNVDYLRSATGMSDVKVHDLRTAVANKVARDQIASMPVPTSAKEYASSVKAVEEATGKAINDTRKAAADNYIDPRVYDSWKQ